MNDFIIPPRNHQLSSTPRVFLVERPSLPSRRPALDNISQSVIVEEELVAEIDIKVYEPKEVIEYRVYAESIGSESKADILARAISNHNPQVIKTKLWRKLPLKSLKPRQIAFSVLAVVVLVLTGYIGLDTWSTNNRLKAYATSDTVNANAVVSVSAEEQQTQEGKDETPLHKDALKNYTVSPDLPRALYIDKIGVAARVLPMGVNSNGSIQAPSNIFDSGWYTGSVKPGEVGAVFIDGHSTGPTHEALFGKLDKLVEGDQILLEKGDGTKLTYKVVHTETVDKDAVNMKSMLLPYDHALRALNLMTCSGTWIESEQTLSKRVLIYTEQI